MGGPEKSAGQFQEIAERDGKLFGDAEQIKPHSGQGGSDPGPEFRLLLPEYTQNRNDDHIETRNESRLSGGRIHQTHLLKRCSRKNHQTGQTATQQNLHRTDPSRSITGVII